MLSFLKQPGADVALNISGEPFYPGGTIDVGVFISSQDKFTVRSGTIELVCTEVYWDIDLMSQSWSGSWGKKEYRRKLFSIKKEFLSNIEFSSGMVLNETARVTLPAKAPPTAIGKTVNITWQLDMKLDVAKMQDIHEERAITVLPMSTAIPISDDSGFAASNQATEHCGEGDLTLKLDSIHLSAGQTIQGSLEAVIQKAVNVEGIRVELEVYERAGEESSSTTADLVQLEQKTSLAYGAYQRWKFALKIPDAPLPTLDISNSSVEWLVKGIFKKRLKRDFWVEYPVQVY